MTKSTITPEEKKLFFPNGNIKERKFLLEGKLEGEYISYFNDGQIMANLHFVRGKKNGEADGEYICYYKNGKLKEKGYFINDKREGEYKAYFKNGQIREQAFYKNGNIIGKFFSFNKNESDINESSTEGSEGIWEEKDVADLLKDLAHFDKKDK